MGALAAAAFAAGHALFPAHWPWVVLTAYIVASGNRSRGDVIYKGGLRVFGAACGTLVAAFLATAFPPGNRWALAAILVILAGGSWLRNASYAYWAGCVTAALALFYGYAGAGGGGAGLLESRLAAIACGAVIAAAAAWLVLPVKTADVLRRRRLAGVLGALTAEGTRGPDPGRLNRAVALLDQVAPAVLARQRIGRFAATARHLVLRGRDGSVGTAVPGRPAAAGARRHRRDPPGWLGARPRGRGGRDLAATRVVLDLPGAPAARAAPGAPAPEGLRAPDGPRAPRAPATAGRGCRIRAASRPRPGRSRRGRTPGGNFGWTTKHFCTTCPKLDSGREPGDPVILACPDGPAAGAGI